MQAELCEITLGRVGYADFVAYYPQVPPLKRRQMFDKLVDAVTEALGPNYTHSNLDDDPYSDSPETNIAFYPKGKIRYVIKIYTVGRRTSMIQLRRMLSCGSATGSYKIKEKARCALPFVPGFFVNGQPLPVRPNLS